MAHFPEGVFHAQRDHIRRVSAPAGKALEQFRIAGRHDEEIHRSEADDSLPAGAHLRRALDIEIHHHVAAHFKMPRDFRIEGAVEVAVDFRAFEEFTRLAFRKEFLPAEEMVIAAIDLAGRDIYDAIRTSVLPKVIDVPSHEMGSNSIDAVAADRIRRVYRKMVRDGSRIEADSPDEDLHELRKRGKELRYELTNERYLEIAGKRDLVGKTLEEAFPELEGQGVKEILRNVFETGTPYFGNEFEAELVRNGKKERIFFNFTCTPLSEEDQTISGLMVVLMEITQMVKAKKQMELNEARLEEEVVP